MAISTVSSASSRSAWLAPACMTLSFPAGAPPTFGHALSVGSSILMRRGGELVETLEHLVTVGAVGSQGAIEVLAVDVHDGAQHVGRGDRPGAAVGRDAPGVLGDERHDVAVARRLGIGPLR